MALGAFFRVVFDARFAADLRNLGAGASAQPEPEPEPEPAPEPAEPTPAPLQTHDPDAALQLLAILQREGRLLDFLQEDLTGAPDDAVGAAAREVHQRCSKALAEHITLVPIRNEEEEAQVTVESGFSASEISLVGAVSGQPPFQGRLRHRGWRASQIDLPRLSPGHDCSLLAPAEIEL